MEEEKNKINKIKFFKKLNKIFMLEKIIILISMDYMLEKFRKFPKTLHKFPKTLHKFPKTSQNQY